MRATRRIVLGAAVLGVLTVVSATPAGARTGRDQLAPSAPTALRVAKAAQKSVTISWKASRDNIEVARYQVRVGRHLSGSTKSKLYRVDTLACGSAYTISVQATDTSGNRSRPASLVTTTKPCSFSTKKSSTAGGGGKGGGSGNKGGTSGGRSAPAPAPEPAPTPDSPSPSPSPSASADAEPPAQPASLWLTAASASQLSVSWSASSDNVGVVSYGAYLDGAAVGSPTSTSYAFSGLGCGTTHELAIDAMDAAGNRSAKTSISAATAACPDTSAPTKPWFVATSSVSGSAVAVTWGTSTDNVGVVGYGIYIGAVRVTDYTGSPVAAWTFTGLTCGTTYLFGIDAFDAAGNRSAKATLSVATTACTDTTPPSAPTGLNASSVSQTGLTFAWVAATDNVGVTGYSVYVNGAGVGTGSGTSYPVSSLACGTAYTLGVEARDGARNVSSRSTLTASTAACPSPAPTTPSAYGAQVFVSTSGNDTTCVRGDQSRPCLTFDRAYRVAQSGDTVSVAGGGYAMTEPNYGGTGIYTTDGHPVTFVCRGDGDVTFAGPIFYFWAGVSNVTFRGGCFRFHVPYIGLGGYSQRTSNITLDGVHMDSFNIAGASNVTIANSEVGPFVACYGPSFEPAYARCDPNSPDPTERFYAGRPEGSGDLQQEPFIHNGGAGKATNITLDHVRVHHISSKWNGTHTGGLLVWGSDGLTIRGSTFDHNAIYDIQFNAGSSDSNVTIENNVFGYPVYSFDPTEPDPGGELPTSFRELGIGTGPGTTNTNWLIRYNSIAHGFITDGLPGTTYNNVRIVGNILGKASTCGSGQPGLTFDHNVFVGRTCGTNALRLTRQPYLDYVGGDYRLVPRSRASCFLENVRRGRLPARPVCVKPTKPGRVKPGKPGRSKHKAVVRE
jgi:chitodextrinase